MAMVALEEKDIMLRTNGKSLFIKLAALIFGFGLLATSCTDSPQPEEPLQSEAAEIPAEPPMDEQVSEPTPPPFSPETVYFGFDSDQLSMDGQDRLKALSDYMMTNSTVNIQIEGHCDERGSVQYNLALGERRAQAVKNYLSNTGIDASRISTISWGKEKPAIPGKDESAWSQNRRAEFNVLDN